jgi:hypothetical protein
MSKYQYTALGHSVRCLDFNSYVFYYSESNGEWMVRENGRLLYADQLNLLLKRDEAILDAHLSEVS